MIRFFISASILALLLVTSAKAQSLPINLLPMFGEVEKTEAMKAMDTAFILSIQQTYPSRKEGSKQVQKIGWAQWQQGDKLTAMLRFNQAWLLDPENGDTYHGFALVISSRGGLPSEVERLFKIAVSKPDVAEVALVDYGRFLWTQKRLDESMVQLNQAINISSTAFNARSNLSFVYFLKGDFVSACQWAKDAKKNKDELEKGYLEDMCDRAKLSGLAHGQAVMANALPAVR